MSSEQPSGTAKNLLRAVTVIVAIEAFAFAVLAVLELFNVSSKRVGMGVVVTIFLLLIAAGLLWAAWCVGRGESWARSPLVFAQLIQLGLAWNFRGDPAWLAPIIALPAVAVLVCLLVPPVTRALNDEEIV